MRASLASRARSLAQRWADFPSPQARLRLLVVAGIVFVVGGVGAARGLAVDPTTLGWSAVAVVAVVGVPLTMVLNGLEYVVSARVVGHRVPLATAMQVAVLSTAANLLPIPGAALVRMQALRQMGAQYRRAASSTLLVALVWLGVSALLAAGLLLPGRSALAWPLMAGGAAALAAGGTLLWVEVRTPARWCRLGAQIVAVELGAVAVTAGRLYLVLSALRVDASPGDAFVLALAAVLASALGVFPGGLGLRELLAAGLAPVVGLAASAGFLATALDRVVGLLASAPIAVPLVLHARARERTLAGSRE